MAAFVNSLCPEIILPSQLIRLGVVNTLAELGSSGFQTIPLKVFESEDPNAYRPQFKTAGDHLAKLVAGVHRDSEAYERAGRLFLMRVRHEVGTIADFYAGLRVYGTETPAYAPCLKGAEDFIHRLRLKMRGAYGTENGYCAISILMLTTANHPTPFHRTRHSPNSLIEQTDA